MFNYLRKVVGVFTQEPVRPEMSLADKLLSRELIETTNDCGEKRYIEVAKSERGERRVTLEILLTKCKRLLSFVSKKSYVNDEYMDVLDIHDKIRNAMYKDDDITPLIEEFEHVQKFIKRSSRSFKDLSSAHLL